MTDQGHSELQQIDDLVAAVKSGRLDIDALTERVDASDLRADVAERRADVAERRADAAQQRADRMEAESVVDREMIAELQAEGMLSREHVANLEAALVASRTIGAALGILMANRNIGQEEALLVLKGASQRTNTKMRDIAETIVAGADAIK